MKSLFLLFALIFIGYNAGAQVRHNLRVNGLLDQSNGLPPGSVNKICRSFNGYLWISTHAGLFIYDGKNYKKIKISDKKEVIPTFLEEDTRGNLWIGSNHGLFKLKNENQVVEERLSDEITGFTVGGGNVWVSTHANHLYQISLRDNQLQLIKAFTQSENKQASLVSDLLLDDLGNLWFRFDGIVYQYNINEKKFQMYEHKKCNKIYSFDGKTIVSFSKNDIHLIEQGKIIANIPCQIGDWLFPFYYSPEEIAILATPNTIFLLHIKNKTISPAGKLPIPSHVVFIKDVKQYDQFTYFACNAGILSLSKTNDQFAHVLKGNSIRSIYQDSKQSFWVASYSGLFHTDKDWRVIHKLAFSDFPYCFLEIDNQLFIGTEGNGLFVYKDQKLQKLNHNLFNRSKEILCLEWIPEDSKIWAGTYQGVLSIDPAMESIKYLANPKYPAFAQSDVHVIKRVQPNIVWIGTKSGLFRATKRNDNWEWDQPIPELANIGISDIKSHANVLWVATMRNGLYKVYPDLSVVKFGFESGLSSDNIVRIEPGNSSDIWVSTEFGLNHMDGDQIESYFEYDGILNNEFNFSSSFSNQQFIFFGGIDGITYFSKNKPPTIQNQSQVFISNISYRDASSKTIQSLHDYRGKNIYISSENKTLSITLGCSDFNFPWLTRYRYKLDNDTVWNYNGTNRMLFFPSLSPGTHKLLISACGANGKWSSKTISINFQVEKAPFLRKADYQILALAILIIFLAYRYLKKKFDIKKREIETNIGKIIQSEMIPPINRKVILTEKIKARFPEVENICEMLYETNIDSKFLIEELSESLINPHENLYAWYKNWKLRIEHLLIFNEIEWQDNILIDNKTKIGYQEEFYLAIVCKEMLQIFIRNKVSKLHFGIYPFEKNWKLIFFAPDSKINLTEQQTFWLIEQLDRQISFLPLEYKMLQEDGFGLEIKPKSPEI